MPGTLKTALAAALAALVVALGACGGDDEEDTTSTTTEPTTTTTGATGPTAAECEEIASIDVATGEFSGLEPDCREGTPPPEPTASDLDLEEAAEAADCDLELDLEDEGNTHIQRSEDVEYGTSPPTSGNHDAVPLADGAYDDQPDDRFVVHALEHGRIAVQYSPDLPEDDQLALKGFFDEDPDGMVLMQNADMPYEVAATAWTNLLGCDTYSAEAVDAIRLFRDEFRGQGPEDIPL